MKRRGKKRSSNRTKEGSSLRGVPRPYTITEAMEHSQKKKKNGPSMTILWKTQQAAESVRSRYLHPINEQKLLGPVVELGKG